MINAEAVNTVSTVSASEAAIRRALARCLQTQTFRRSPKLAAFLTFVVEEELAGRGEAIKAYTIATRALSRSTSFDPTNDPSVRVEAGRLRRALEEAQGQDGVAWPVRIHVPVGGYRPVFEFRNDAPPPDSPVFPLPHPPEIAPPARPAAPLFDTRGQAVIAGLLAAIVLLLAIDVGLTAYAMLTPQSQMQEITKAGAILPADGTISPPGAWPGRVAQASQSDRGLHDHEIGIRSDRRGD